MDAQGGRVARGGSRSAVRKASVAAALLAHFVLGSVLAAYALTLSTGDLALLAAEAVVFLMLALTLLYVYRFGRSRLGIPRVRTGPLGIARGHLLFLMWLVLGFLAVLLALGPGLTPDQFLFFLLAWWALVVVYLIAIMMWRRQSPARRAWARPVPKERQRP